VKRRAKIRTIAERGKDPLDLVLMRCLAEVAIVLEHGNARPGRGPFNWRRARVLESNMIAGALRHLLRRASGEKRDRHSGKRHLAHVVARCLIAMDAEDHGNLIEIFSKGRK